MHSVAALRISLKLRDRWCLALSHLVKMVLSLLLQLYLNPSKLLAIWLLSIPGWLSPEIPFKCGIEQRKTLK